MKTLSWLVLPALFVSGCDPGQSVSVSAEVAEPLAEDCIVAALRSADAVLRADADGLGIRAVIPMPEEISQFPEGAIGVSLEPADDGHPRVEVYGAWVGSPTAPEFVQSSIIH